jgi:hypothetical protein
MRAKKKQPENPEKSIANTMGNAVNAVKKLAEAMGQLPADKFPEINDEQQIVPGLDAVEIEQPAGAFEIVPGMTVEEMTAMFFDGALIEPPYKVWQLNSKGHRYYYKFDDNGTPEFYPSVTTILSQTMPQSPFLIKWIADKGIDEAERYKAERAAYGTFMHAQFEELIINRVYDLDGLKAKLKDYIDNNKLPADFIYYADDFKKDILAFAQFVLDYDVKPLAVEIALVHPVHNYAGMIDLPCTMLSKPGSKEYINAIVDFKSGRKGFYEEAEIQLHLYAMMWNENFPDIPIDRVFNFSPKDWRKKPTYNLKDQTDSPNAKKIPYLLELAAIEDEKRDNTFTAVSGEISLDNEPDLTNNIVSLTLAELVKSKAPAEKKKPEPEKAVTVEDLKKDPGPEPQPEPEPEEKKTKTVKRTTRKTAKTAGNKPVKEKKTAKRTITPKKEKVAKIEEKQPKKPEPEKAVTVEDLKKDPGPEPQPEPEPEEKKTKTVKRTTRKTAKTAGNKPVKEKKTAKRTITPKKEKVAKIEEKQPKKPGPVTKKDLLNTEIDI